jgi:hypothetical protein
LFSVLELAERGQAMKLVDSEKAEPIPLDTAWKYFRDLINGLDYCNILVDVFRN